MKITDNLLKTIISQLTGVVPQKIYPETALVKELHMDSLKIVELLAILNEEYQISVTEKEAMKFYTYQDLLNFTQKASTS